MSINADGTERWLAPGVPRCRETEWRILTYRRRQPESKRVQCGAEAGTPHEHHWHGIPFGGPGSTKHPPGAA